MTKKVMLFYADWCGHCTTFKPIWQELKKTFDVNGIEHSDFEDTKNKEEMSRYNIGSYPTIKIEENGEVTEYNGLRDYNSILSYLEVGQSGGGYMPLSLNKKFKINSRTNNNVSFTSFCFM